MKIRAVLQHNNFIYLVKCQKCSLFCKLNKLFNTLILDKLIIFENKMIGMTRAIKKILNHFIIFLSTQQPFLHIKVKCSIEVGLFSRFGMYILCYRPIFPALWGKTCGGKKVDSTRQLNKMIK